MSRRTYTGLCRMKISLGGCPSSRLITVLIRARRRLVPRGLDCHHLCSDEFCCDRDERTGWGGAGCMTLTLHCRRRAARCSLLTARSRCRFDCDVRTSVIVVDQPCVHPPIWRHARRPLGPKPTPTSSTGGRAVTGVFCFLACPRGPLAT
jgi:hypothetical protein